MKPSGKLIGLAVGLAAGALLILAGWRVFLILLAFGLVGYLIGAYLESRGDLVKRMREFFNRMFGA